MRARAVARTVACATLAAAVGCSQVSGPQPPPPHPSVRAPEPPRVRVAVPLDSTWRATLAFLARERIPVESADRAAGTISSTRFDLTAADSAKWVKCQKPNTPLLEKSPATIRTAATLRVELHPVGDTTVVRVLFSATAVLRKTTAPDASNPGTFTADCASTGALEAALIASLRPIPNARADSAVPSALPPPR